MRNGNLRAAFRGLAIAAVIIAPATALAHAFILQPPPRDIAVVDLNARSHTTGPCGAVPRTGPPTQYEAGAKVLVKWEETIDHTGCYQVAFSAANDQNFVTLTQVTDPAGTVTPFVYQASVTLPAGVTCKQCTLQLRQLSLEGTANTTCAPDAAPGVTGVTYYSCADICVGTDCGDAAVPANDGGIDASPGTDSGGPTTVPTDGGGKTVPTSPDGTPPDLHAGDGGGCSVALGATSGVSFAITFGLFGLALLRRRRNKK